jgi:hypothetical protein
MRRIWIATLLLAVSASLAAAADSSKLKLLSVELTSGTADIATEISTGFSGYAPAFDHSEWGVKAEYWNMMGPEYAFTIGGGIGMFSEEDKPGSNAAVGDAKQSYSQSSWNIRVGGDRMVGLGEKSFIFVGPGIEYWSGKAKFKDESVAPNTLDYETKDVARISLSARVGGHMMVSPAWGFTVQAGTKIGRASYKENGAETTWWPSSMEGALGLVFKFGS